MADLNIDCPLSNYIECVYKFCKENKFSMILKRSLANGVTTKNSDIDLIILGNIECSKINVITKLYGNPVKTNFTDNPKGIIILVYKDNISVDLDIRDKISQKNLMNSEALLKYDFCRFTHIKETIPEMNFIINNERFNRKLITSHYVPIWDKTLRSLHRVIIK